MDFYQQYDLTCVISLCDSDKILVADGSLYHIAIDDGITYKTKHSQRFQLNERTGELKEIFGQIVHTKENHIYIDNVTQQIHNLYTTLTLTETAYDLQNNRVFLAIAKYFESCLNTACKYRNTNVQEMYLVFIIPDHWALIPDITSLIMIPILSKVGIKFPAESRDRALFITKLETELSFFQLGNPKNQEWPLFIHNENRCVLYKLKGFKKQLTVNSTYFQMKEEYNMRLLNNKCYIPKMLSKNSHILFDDGVFDHIKQMLCQLLFKEIFDTCMEDVSDPKILKINDVILDVVLSNAVRYLQDERSKFCYINNITEGLLKMRLTEAQILVMQSDMFLETFIKQLRRLFSSQLDNTITHLIEQTDNIPFHRKSVIFRAQFENMGDFQEYASMAFLLFLKTEFYIHYKDVDKSTWYISFDQLSDIDLAKGGILVAARKAMVENIGLPPKVIDVITPSQDPLYSPVNRATTIRNIAYLDIMKGSIHLICESVDECGRIIKQVNIDVQELHEKILFDHFDISSFEKPSDGTNIKIRKQLTEREMLLVALGRRISPIEDTPFEKYFSELLNLLDNVLESSDEIGHKYALSFEEEVLDCFVGCRSEIFDFLNGRKDANYRSNVVIIDQGEKVLWDRFQDRLLKTPSYCVHAHMLDSSIALKLHQVVDVTNLNDGEQTNATMLIKSRYLTMNDTYRQVGEQLWSYIQSLDKEVKGYFVYPEAENFPSYLKNYELFNNEIMHFFKEGLFCNEYINDRSYLFELKHKLKISEDYGISITIRELIDVAVVPVLKRTVSEIISCLLDKNVFGHFEIAQLFVTGCFLRIQEHSSVYHSIITTELAKELKQLIRENTYRTKFNLHLDTSICKMPISNDFQKKSFCYDHFLKGELRVVASTTYTVNGHSLGDTITITGEFMSDDSKTDIIIDGTEINERRIEVCAPFEKTMDSSVLNNRAFRMDIQRHTQNTSSSLKANSVKHLLGKATPNSLSTLQIEVLHHISCIKFTFESYGNANEYTRSLIFGERQTLKYFS